MFIYLPNILLFYHIIYSSSQSSAYNTVRLQMAKQNALVARSILKKLNIFCLAWTPFKKHCRSLNILLLAMFMHDLIILKHHLQSYGRDAGELHRWPVVELARFGLAGSRLCLPSSATPPPTPGDTLPSHPYWSVYILSKERCEYKQYFARSLSQVDNLLDI